MPLNISSGAGRPPTTSSVGYAQLLKALCLEPKYRIDARHLTCELRKGEHFCDEEERRELLNDPDRTLKR
jgi:hypothetical protein